jgi:hypothetical protein
MARPHKKNNLQHPGRFIGAIEEIDNNIGYYTSAGISIPPADFIPSSSTKAGYLGLNGQFAVAPSDREVLVAQKIIPFGYTATHCVVTGNETGSNPSTFQCFEGNTTGAVPAARSAAIALNATATFASAHSNIVGDGNKFCTIVFDPGDNADCVYGAVITLTKT